MIHIVITAKGLRQVTACAVDAIARTTPEPHSVEVFEARPAGATYAETDGAAANAAKLDAAVAHVPAESTDLFVMHNDAAPLARGWLSWLLHLRGDGAWAMLGPNASVGTLFRIDFLRDTLARTGRLFNAEMPRMAPGDWLTTLAPGARASLVGRSPWWLRHSDCAFDEHGNLLFAHLGGATIGATWRVPGTLRLWWHLPRSLWPLLVRRHLAAQGLDRPMRLVHGRWHNAKMQDDHE